jgi:hypothetical protein
MRVFDLEGGMLVVTNYVIINHLPPVKTPIFVIGGRVVFLPQSGIDFFCPA